MMHNVLQDLLKTQNDKLQCSYQSAFRYLWYHSSRRKPEILPNQQIRLFLCLQKWHWVINGSLCRDICSLWICVLHSSGWMTPDVQLVLFCWVVQMKFWNTSKGMFSAKISLRNFKWAYSRTVLYLVHKERERENILDYRWLLAKSFYCWQP